MRVSVCSGVRAAFRAENAQLLNDAAAGRDAPFDAEMRRYTVNGFHGSTSLGEPVRGFLDFNDGIVCCFFVRSFVCVYACCCCCCFLLLLLLLIQCIAVRFRRRDAYFLPFFYFRISCLSYVRVWRILPR